MNTFETKLRKYLKIYKIVENEKLTSTQISPIYQSILQFANPKVGSGAPERLSFEHFLPWIYKIMLAYQEQEETESDNYAPEGIRYSKSYYIKKFR